MEGSKCIDDDRVEYSATIGADVRFVVVFVRTFFRILIEAAEKASIDPKNPLKLAIESIHLKDIKKGSAIL